MFPSMVNWPELRPNSLHIKSDSHIDYHFKIRNFMQACLSYTVPNKKLTASEMRALDR